MTNVRYIPNSFTVEPWAFGVARAIEWNEASTSSPAEAARLRAAQVQHLVSCTIRKRLKPNFGTLKGFADAAGIDHNRLSRLMKGHQVMRIEDITLVEHVLGPIIELTGSGANRDAPSG